MDTVNPAPTPRTDALDNLLKSKPGSFGGNYDKLRSHARQLETELTLALPRLWDAESIGGAPEGEYRLRKIDPLAKPDCFLWSLKEVVRELTLYVGLPGARFDLAYGPIPAFPQPPVKA